MSDIFSPKEWALLGKRSGTLRKLHREMLFVGRSECDIILDSPSVDNRHSVLCFNPTERKFFIKDLNSTHGTFINDKKVACQSYVILNHMDTLRFGFSPDIYMICKTSLINDFSASPVRVVSPSINEIVTSPKFRSSSPADGSVMSLSLVHSTRETVLPLSQSMSSDRIRQTVVNESAIFFQPPFRKKGQQDSGSFTDAEKLSRSLDSRSFHSLDSEQSTVPSAMAFTISFEEETNVRKKPQNLSGRFKRFNDQLGRKEKSASPPPPEKNGHKGQSRSQSAVADSRRLTESASSSGHLSESATYLIQRMLASNVESPEQDDEEVEEIANQISDKANVSRPAAGSIEKDSGVCDDKSENGTYTLALDNADIALEKARQQIDEVFGVHLNSLENSPTQDNPAQGSSSACVANSKVFWENQFTPTSPELVDPTDESERSSTFTRPKRRESSDSATNSYNSSPISSARRSKVRGAKEAEDNAFSLPVELSKLKTGLPSGSQSPSSVTSRSSFGNKKSNKKYGQSPLAARKIVSPSLTRSESEESSENGSLSRSDMQPISSSLKLNRAFALRRARLGIDTPGVSLNLSKEKTNKPTTPSSRFPSDNFARSDGGRFSLRAPKGSAIPMKPPTGLSASREKLNKATVARHGSDSTQSKSRPASGRIPSRETVKKSTTTVNMLRQIPIQRSSSFGTNKLLNTGNSDRLMRGLPTVQKAAGRSNHQLQVDALRNNSKAGSPRARSDRMSSSMIEHVSTSPEVLESPTAKALKSRELSALDSLVIQAILQLSHKVRQKLQECLERERVRFPADCETRLMVEEILPQLSIIESPVHQSAESGPSKDLSNILKHLKKAEQSLEVLSLLGEINSGEDYKGEDLELETDHDF
ncbi:putative centrosomal protein [Halotydeus destructor]|nr:putative centrosomal protein [Halotydeus destructor]